MELKREELSEIKGGSYIKLFAIGGIVIFIIGFIDGYMRPLKCNT